MNRKCLKRRQFLKAAAIVGAGTLGGPRRKASAEPRAPAPPETLDIGSGLELAVDPRWIDSISGLRLVQQTPIPREVVLDSPPTDPAERRDLWASRYGYLSVLKDGDLYRMHYRYVYPSDDQDGHEFFCYAESRDGVNWTKPDLGLFTIPESKDRNAITEENMAEPGDEDSDHFPCISHNLRPFIDTRPGVPEAERFKALGAGYNSGSPNAGFWALSSADGIHWKKIRKGWVIDRKNWSHGSDSTPACSWWSEDEGKYVAYIRIRVNPNDPTKGKVGGLRWIGRITSDDFIHWSQVTPMQPLDGGLDVEKISGRHVHHYTNETQPYYRNRQLLIATPTRFFEGSAFSDEEIATLTPEMQNYLRQRSVGYTDAVLLTSRPGEISYRQPFQEAYLRPGPDVRNWGNRSTYPHVRFVPTGDTEMSQYVRHGLGSSSYVRRYTLRIDGFASVWAPLAGGELVTKPLKFSGGRLVMNYSTSGAGSIRVEVGDENGKPLPGYELANAYRHLGDTIEQTVQWKTTRSVGGLKGRAVRLRFVIHDADLYSFRFV